MLTLVVGLSSAGCTCDFGAGRGCDFPAYHACLAEGAWCLGASSIQSCDPSLECVCVSGFVSCSPRPPPGTPCNFVSSTAGALCDPANSCCSGNCCCTGLGVVVCIGSSCGDYFACVRACDGGCTDSCQVQLTADAQNHVISANWCAGLWCKQEGRCVLDESRNFVDPPGGVRGRCAACRHDAMSTVLGESCSTSGADCNPPTCAAAFAACFGAADLGVPDLGAPDDGAFSDGSPD